MKASIRPCWVQGEGVAQARLREDDVAGGVTCPWVRLLDWLPGRTVGLDADLRLFCVHTIHILPVHSHIRFPATRLYAQASLLISLRRAFYCGIPSWSTYTPAGWGITLVPETFSRSCTVYTLGFHCLSEIVSGFLYHHLLPHHHPRKALPRLTSNFCNIRNVRVFFATSSSSYDRSLPQEYISIPLSQHSLWATRGISR